MDTIVRVLVLLIMCSLTANSSPTHDKEGAHARADCDEAGKRLAIVSRADWGARPPKRTTPMRNPVPYVIVHHTAIPTACHTADECEAAMRGMQNFHMDDRGWNDVGYNFAIGGDGRVYMGRGWTTCGAHAPSYNNVSVGVALIGDWSAVVPPPAMIERAHALLAYGVRGGHVRQDYVLYGHRQVRDTECPGDAFYATLRRWPHWDAHPPRKIVGGREATTEAAAEAATNSDDSTTTIYS